MLTTFAGVLEYPADYRWSAEPGETGVVVSLAGTSAGSADGRTLAETDGSAFRTSLRIPLVHNRAELGLLYTAIMGHSTTRVSVPGAHELVPGEFRDWSFTGHQAGATLARLEDEGLIQWDGDEEGWLFDAGPAAARFRVERARTSRPHGSTGMRISAVIPGLDLSAIRSRKALDADVLGSWRHGLARALLRGDDPARRNGLEQRLRRSRRRSPGSAATSSPTSGRPSRRDAKPPRIVRNDVFDWSEER